ncbi:hypothetical protein [Hymenobacter arizonensis]|uniref:hypothetical protein n=1 Tax=Hymenobacter arizonensis TaxID=1227077 RepID=UPI000B892653|nr:hypothetical protein [Hymenobacter arizonensis]
MLAPAASKSSQAASSATTRLGPRHIAGDLGQPARFPLSGKALPAPPAKTGGRERISFDEGWRFFRYGPNVKPDSLFYDVRPEVRNERDDKAADSRPTEAVTVAATQTGLKS